MERLAAKEVIVGTPTREVLPSHEHCMNGSKVGSEDKERYECLECFIIFSTEQQMLRHNKKFHKDVYMRHLQKNNTVFLCYKCNKRFQSPAKLRQHSLSHGTDDKPFPCVVCREAYSTFTELTTHRREVCPKRKFHCKVCGMNFQNLESLETHKSVHPLRRLGRPPRRKASARGTPDRETMLTDDEEEEEDDEEEEEEEEEDEEELNGRAADQRASTAQTLWITDEEATVADGEVEVEAEDQRALRAQTSNPQERASESLEPRYDTRGYAKDNCDLTFVSMEALRVHKQEADSPQPDALSASPETKAMVPTKEEEQEDIDGRAEDQVTRLPTKRTLTAVNGCPSKRMASEQWMPLKTMVPKEEEEEEEVDDRSIAQRALRAKTSMVQRLASGGQQPRYSIPCPVDNCELTFPSVEVLRVHRKEAHRPKPTTELAPPHIP